MPVIDIPTSGYSCIFFMMEFIHLYLLRRNTVKDGRYKMGDLNIRSTALLEDQQDINVQVFIPLEKYGRYTGAISD